mmetsp:Transcript_19462/g.60942  ORF Transcript_19462/g.60942 Transcript_19462/m.60942 type:complete len:131 (+) Transcript_19462:510-902(+)
MRLDVWLPHRSHRVSFHEFCAAALDRRVDLDDASLHAAFEAIDSEGLGYITREAVLATMGADAARYGTAGDVDAALAAADSDGDGRVDYNEFLDYVHARRKSARIAVAAAASPIPGNGLIRGHGVSISTY